jgi:hypothetical protein
MERVSPRQLALASVSFANVVQRMAGAQALRVGRQVEMTRDSVSARIHPRPQHRIRNSLLGVAASIALTTLAAALLGRRKSLAPSPVQQAGTAAKETRRQEPREDDGVGISDALAAGVSAVKTGAHAVQEDAALGAATIKDAPGEAVHEKVDATKEKVAAVKENVAGKLIRVGIIAAIGLTAYILVMSVLVALIVSWIV